MYTKIKTVIFAVERLKNVSNVFEILEDFKYEISDQIDNSTISQSKTIIVSKKSEENIDKLVSELAFLALISEKSNFEFLKRYKSFVNLSYARLAVQEHVIRQLLSFNYDFILPVDLLRADKYLGKTLEDTYENISKAKPFSHIINEKNAPKI